MESIGLLWRSGDENDWISALERYWPLVKPVNLALEEEMQNLDARRVARLDARGWYDFLHDKYFRWKYTAPNRLATTRNQLARYAETDTLHDLLGIKERLFSFDRDDIAEGLRIASAIRGLGTAGASGLLALLFPESFATVDQFVVKALRDVGSLPEHDRLMGMREEGLAVRDGVTLIQIMRNKAAENNRAFGTDTWTPRKIDMVLWTYGR